MTVRMVRNQHGGSSIELLTYESRGEVRRGGVENFLLEQVAAYKAFMDGWV
jgi:hypothetical protein